MIEAAKKECRIPGPREAPPTAELAGRLLDDATPREARRQGDWSYRLSLERHANPYPPFMDVARRMWWTGWDEASVL